MHFPRYWVRAEDPGGGCVWGWSDTSREEAGEHARVRAARVSAALAAGREPDRYEYGSRGPLREEVLRELDPALSGGAILSRNRYGALVLNTTQVMFIDIDDLPRPREASSGGFFSLFRKKPVVPPSAAPFWQAQREAIEATIREQASIRCALYRTCAGFRLLVTNQLFQPHSAEANRLFDTFKSDPLYIRLTRAQSCFRARLTPKPWRCGLKDPAWDYPRPNAQAEEVHRRWEQDYETVSSRFATCTHLGDYGPGRDLPEATFVRELHDTFCLKPGLPLA